MRRAPAPAMTAESRDLVEVVFPGQDEDPSKTGSLAGQDIGPEVVTDHRDLGSSEASSTSGPPAPSARSASIAIEKNLADGLPMICARTPVAYSSPVTYAPESRVGPSGVSHQGLRCMPISRAPFRTSLNARFRFS